MKAILIALLILLTAGCMTPIGNPPVSNWPDVKVVWHRVSTKEMTDFCAKHNDIPLNGLLYYIMGCAEVDFDRMVCDIYVDKDFPDAKLDKHERLHCDGWDHPGASGMRDAWMRWQQRQP